MKNPRRWMNSIAAGLLMLQVISNTTVTLAQTVLNNDSSQARVVSDLYFQDSTGNKVTNIKAGESSATVYVKDNNASDTQATIDLPEGVKLDAQQTKQLNQGTQAKVNYDAQKQQVIVDYSAAKQAADEVTKQQEVVSQTKSALTSAQNQAKTESEKASKESVQIKHATFDQQVIQKKAEVQKALAALNNAQAKAETTPKLAGLAFKNESKSDRILKAQTTRNNIIVTSANLIIRGSEASSQSVKQSSSSEESEKTDANRQKQVKATSNIDFDMDTASSTIEHSISYNLSANGSGWPTDAAHTKQMKFTGNVKKDDTIVITMPKGVTVATYDKPTGFTVTTKNVNGNMEITYKAAGDMVVESNISYFMTQQGDNKQFAPGKTTLPVNVVVNSNKLADGSIIVNNPINSSAESLVHNTAVSNNVFTADGESIYNFVLGVKTTPDFTASSTQITQAVHAKMSGRIAVPSGFVLVGASVANYQDTKYNLAEDGSKVPSIPAGLSQPGGAGTDIIVSDIVGGGYGGYNSAYLYMYGYFKTGTPEGKYQFLPSLTLTPSYFDGSEGNITVTSGKTDDITIGDGNPGTMEAGYSGTLEAHNGDQVDPNHEGFYSKQISTDNGITGFVSGKVDKTTINNVAALPTITVDFVDDTVNQINNLKDYTLTLPAKWTGNLTDITFSTYRRGMLVDSGNESDNGPFKVTLDDGTVYDNIATLKAPDIRIDAALKAGAHISSVSGQASILPGNNLTAQLKNAVLDDGAYNDHDKIPIKLDVHSETSNTDISATGTLYYFDKDVKSTSQFSIGSAMGGDISGTYSQGDTFKTGGWSTLKQETSMSGDTDGKIIIPGGQKPGSKVKIKLPTIIVSSVDGGLIDLDGSQINDWGWNHDGKRYKPVITYLGLDSTTGEYLTKLDFSNETVEIPANTNPAVAFFYPDALPWKVSDVAPPANGTTSHSILQTIDNNKDALHPLYGGKVYNGSIGQQWTITAPLQAVGKAGISGSRTGITSYFTTMTGKAGFDRGLRSDDADDDNTGNIMLGISNGSNYTYSNSEAIVNLPNVDHDAFTLELTGPVDNLQGTGTEALYSTVVHDLPASESNTSVDLTTSDWKTASDISDWSTVKSIALKSDSVASKEVMAGYFPVKVSDIKDRMIADEVTMPSYIYGESATLGSNLSTNIPLSAQIYGIPQAKVRYEETTDNSTSNGTTLAPEDILTGVDTNGTTPAFGKYTSNKKDIADYTYVGLSSDSAAAEGTLKDDTEDVIYLYKLTPGSVILTKVSSENGDKLSGAVFKVVNSAGEVIKDNLTTDADGKISVEDLAPGEYKFIETSAPDGFYLNSNEIPFTIEKGQTKPLEVEVKDDPKPKPKIVKEASVTDAKVGDSYEYTLTVSNGEKAGVWKNVVTTDKLDDNLNIDESNLPSGVTYDNDTRTITWKVGDLKASESKNIKFKVTVNNQPANGVVPNTAEAKGQDKDGKDINVDDNVDVNTDYQLGDLDAVKSVKDKDGKDINGQDVKVGDTIHYDITVSNTVPNSIINNVHVKDEIPVGLDYVAGSLTVDGTAAADSNVASNILNIDLGTMKGENTATGAKADKKVVGFDVKVTEEASGSLKNIAVVNGDDPNHPTPVPPVENNAKPEPKIVKEASVTDTKVGDSYEYTLTVSNGEKAGIWKNVVTTDKLDDNLNIDESSLPSGVTYDSATRTITWKVGDLKANASKNVKFKVTVNNKPANGVVPNTAEAKGQDKDGKEYKVDDDVDVNVDYQPGDFTAVKSVKDKDGKDINGQDVKVGDTIHYDITVSNTVANSIINNVHVHDEIPAGLAYTVGSLTIDGTKQADTNVVSGVLDVDLGTMKGENTATGAKADKKVVGFDVKVTEEASGSLKNIAVVNGDDPNHPTPVPPVENNAKPEPKIVKEASVTDTKVGDSYEYTLTVSNGEKAGIWKNVVTTDKLDDNLNIDESSLPSGVTYDSATRTITWKVGDLKANASKNVKFKVTVNNKPANGVVPNTAEAKGQDKDGKEYKVDDDVDVNVDYQPGDFTAVKSVKDKDGKDINGQDVKVGDTIHYDITVSNTVANSIINNVHVHDEIPAGLAYTVGSLTIDGTKQADINVVSGVLDVDLGTMKGENTATGAKADKKVVGFDVKVTEEASGSLKNIAVVNGDDPNHPTPVPPVENNAKPEPKIVKEASVTDTKVGDSYEYTLTVSNGEKAGIWKNVVTTDKLDDNLNIDKSSLSSGVTYDSATRTITWKVGDLKANASKNVKFKVTVNNKPANGVVPNTAEAKGQDKDGKEYDVDDDTTVNVDYQSGDFDAVKSVKDKDGKDINGQDVKVGDTIHYDITVSNTVPNSIINNVHVKDEIPVGLDYVAGSLTVDGTAAADSNVASNILNIDLGTMKGENTATGAKADKKVVGFDVKVTEEASGSLKNIAVVNGDDPNHPTPVPPVENNAKPEPKIVKEASVTDTKVGDSYEYTLTVSNGEKAGIWKNVVTTDKLDDNLNIDKSSLSSGVTYDSATRTITWKVGDLKANASKNVKFKVTVNNKPANGVVPNTAEAKGQDKDGKEYDVDDDTTVNVDYQSGDFDAVKSVKDKDGKDINGQDVKVGDTIHYDITVSNTVPNSIINNVHVKDEIPVGLDYVAGSLTVDGTAAADSNVASNILNIDLGTMKGENTATGVKADKKVVGFDVKVTEEASGSLKNIAVVNGDDPNHPTPVPPVENNAKPEPKIVKEASVTDTKVGDSYEYTLTVSNGEKAGIWKNVVTTDKLDDNLNIDESSLSSGVTYDSATRTITWKVGDLKANASKNVKFKVTVNNKPANGVVPNTAEAKGQDKDGKEYDVDDDTTVNVDYQSGDFDAVKSVKDKDGKDINGQDVKVGDTIHYDITVSNTVPNSIINNVHVKDEIPVGLDYVAGSLTVDGTAAADSNVASNILNIDLGTMKGENTATGVKADKKVVGFDVKVTEEASGSLKNIAVVNGDDPNHPTPVPPVENNAKPKPKLVKGADVQSASLGESFNYILTVSNGEKAGVWYNGVVKDTLDENLTLDESSLPKDVKYDATSRTITWNTGDLKANKVKKLKFKVTVNNIPEGKEIPNIAHGIGTDNDGKEYAVDGEHTVPVDYVPGDFDAVKSVKDKDGKDINGQDVKVGDTIHYDITVSNTVPNSIINSVHVHDEIPMGLNYVEGSLKVNEKAVDDAYIASNILDIDLGTMKGEDTANGVKADKKVVGFDVTVTEDASGDLKNVAVVNGDSPNNPKPTPPVDNQDNPEPKLVKEASLANAKVDDSYDYTLTVSNAEKAGVWKGAVVTDKLDKSIELSQSNLPEGVKYNSDTRTLTWKVGNLSGGASAQISFKVKVVSLTTDGQVINIAKGNGTDKDGNQFTVSDEADVTIDSNVAPTPDAPNPSVTPATPNNNYSWNKFVKNLPQTGQAAMKVAPYLGILLLIIALGLAWYKYNKRKS
ncbi:isopeptide-forming domain-containing fimbrial protein [Latilactobacillus sp. 5-91]|uniref:isopeptide-forming domain-containing fimbrial protein n=1 Tax=Latilactobacillus sp. 5-91 TaxID=3410924 RepID=UPI003C741ADB